jgi:DNA-binding XRE family transcriptional regulator
MSISAADVRFVRDVFDLTRGELAKALGVAAFTVNRWERDGGSQPSGLQAEVLGALHTAALELRGDPHWEVASGLIRLGIGATVHRALTSGRREEI